MASASNPPLTATPPNFFADFYTFNWSELSLRLPLVSASAVAICLFIGVSVGHPGGGLIAGGGALTIGFGANQRIADSRLLPMLAALFSTSTATCSCGTPGVGHSATLSFPPLRASAFIYGVLTARDLGLSWVGQQASVALLVASAFPTGPRLAFIRAGLILAGGALQILITSIGLSLMPDLRKHLLTIPSTIYNLAGEQRREIQTRLNALPQSIPALSHSATLGYSLRLVITISIATEIYHRLGIQSGYWIPMTALLVQKPGFLETLTRTSSRIVGTLLGAWACSLLIAHLTPRPVTLAAVTTLFALCTFAANSVNYGLFTAFLTGYIVFLLSLNQIPGPVIAHRRAWCTILGGLIALAVHIDALYRRRSTPSVT